MTARDEYIKKVVAAAPPLSPEQERAIARIFDIEGQRAQRRADRRPYSGGAPPGLTRRRFSGAPEHSNDEVLEAYRKRWDEGLERSPMYSMYHTSPEDTFRWRTQFDCGCVEERITGSDDPQSILDGSDRDWRSSEALPPGQYWCRGDHPKRDLPLRAIASWDERVEERELPADPIEPPEYVPDARHMGKIPPPRSAGEGAMEGHPVLRSHLHNSDGPRVDAGAGLDKGWARAARRDADRVG